MASTSEQVVELLERRQSFIVEAGAGAGKTRTLVSALSYLLSHEAKSFLSTNQKLVCITYTNVAANEITSRINRDPLVRVSTIHEFLWSVIAPFQAELRDLIVDANAAAEGRKKVDGLNLQGMAIEYWQFPRKYERGKIGHDDVIDLSSRLFAKYPKVSRLLADRYPVIFVDEYQDTSPRTIDLLLDRLLAQNPGRVTVGLFGDHMQQIYNTGVGRVERDDLEVVQKSENFRCSLSVIAVLNQLRLELKQVAGGANLQGSARFLYSENGDADVVANLREELAREGWSESTSKVLMLTRRGIADSLEWPQLLAVCQKRSSFGVDNLITREDEFGAFFASIEELAAAFDAQRFGDFLAMRGRSGMRILQHGDKKTVVNQMTRLSQLRENSTVGEVVDFVMQDGLLRKPRRLQALEDRIALAEDPERAERDSVFLSSLRDIPYLEVIKFEQYLNNETPFSTNHGVKGEEYDDVLVVLDDRLWNQYKFESVLADDTSKTQFQRSLNLLYVSCSRAKRNLVVLALSPMSATAIDGAERIFGEGMVRQID